MKQEELTPIYCLGTYVADNRKCHFCGDTIPIGTRAISVAMQGSKNRIRTAYVCSKCEKEKMSWLLSIKQQSTSLT